MKSVIPVRRIFLASVVALSMTGCTDNTAAVSEDETEPSVTSATSMTVPLKDVIETTPTHIVGISYDPALKASPELAATLSDYASQARTDLLQALAELGNDSPRVPYELSLAFDQVASTPTLKVIAANGSLYTGGAHGMPLVARFVWMVEQDRQLTADELIPRKDSRQAIADHVEGILLSNLSERLRYDHTDLLVQKQVEENARAMIAEGTEPLSENFRHFEPVVDDQGRITAIQFVFPPYQVGPYSDGVQTVDVPAAVILPHVDPRYANLLAPSHSAD